MMHLTWLTLSILAAPQTAELSPDARLKELLPGLSSSDAAQLDSAWTALERLCFDAGRPGAESERKAMSTAITSKLAEEGTAPVRVILLRALELVGKGEAVPPLAKLISPGNDPAIREGARRALEANPHVNAKKELRLALQHADGALRVGIIHSLGVRRDFLATADLISAAEDKDSAVKLAALDALAEIGDVSAVPVLEQALGDLKGLELASTQRAYLRLADSLVRNGERGQARRIYDKASGFSPAHRAAALIGFARAGLQSEIERIAGAMDDLDPKVRGAAVEAAGIIAGDGMTKALLAKLERAPTTELVRILERRGGSEARAAIVATSKSAKDLALRVQAVRSIGLISTEKDAVDTAQVLLDLLAVDGGEVSDAAEAVLSTLRGPVTVAVAERLKAAAADQKLPLIRILGARRDLKDLSALVSSLDSGTIRVRSAVFAALGEIGDAACAPTLLASLRAAEGPERDAAMNALARLQGEAAARAIAVAFADATGAFRSSLLRVIGKRRDSSSVELLKKASADADPAVRQSAIEGLALASDPTVLSILLDAAEKGSSETQAAAVRGALRFADELAKVDRAKGSLVYLKALELAKSEEELRVALRGVAETCGPESLERIVPHLKKGPLQRDAGRAALRLAERFPDDKQAGAREIYERILDLDPDKATATQCVRRLRRLGVETDFGRANGFVTRWWIAAPFPNSDGALWEKSLSPESGVDLSKPVEHEGQKYDWKMYLTPSPLGLVELDEAGYGTASAGAYLYTEITVKNACDAVFKLGSDDQIVCWLNGVKVHANRVNRGLGVDQDSVDVKLGAGVNRILLKVLNDSGGWGACLRVTDRAGKPSELAQKEK